jgi:hypothetical protein
MNPLKSSQHTNFHRRLIRPYRLGLVCFLFSITIFFDCAKAQFNTPIIDGNIVGGEYGTHVDGQNQQLEAGTTWLMTWDNTNLYIAFTGSNATEGGVIYLDFNPIIPVNGGTDADGSTGGFYYYDRNQATQPFRADFVLYFKDSYHEYRYADGAGYYGAQTANTLPVASNLGTNTVEIAIPWNVITQGAGRPRSFNWHGNKVYDYGPANNGVYSSIPNGNPNCACNQDPSVSFITHYYNVLRTGNLLATKPFSTISFTYHEDRSTPTTGGYYLNGGTFYDITINDNSADNTDNDPTNFFYDNLEISNRLLVDGAISISHNLYIGQGSALLPADNIGPAVLSTITMNGADGSLFNFGRLDANPEVSVVNDWNNRRIDFVFDGVTTVEASPLFKDRFRLSNVTINTGDSLLGPATDSVELELQYGTFNNNGVISAGEGTTGVLDIGTRGDVPQQNDFFFNSSGATGVWLLHDLLIGRNSSALRPVNTGNVVSLQIKGNFENYDDFLGQDGTGAIDIVMNGRLRQEIRGNTTETTGGATTFRNLEIANSSGISDYNNSADVYFVSYGGGTINYFITGELRLTSGDLVTRDRGIPTTVHSLQLNEGATVVSSGAISNVTTLGSSFVDGPLSWEVATAAPTLRTFPVGKSLLASGYLLGDYRQVQLNLDHDVNTSTIYTAEMFLVDQSATYTWPSPTPELITWISKQRYWNVTKGAGATVQSAQITLDYDIDERNDGVTNPAGLRIVKDDGAGNWINIAVGGTGTGIGTGSITSTPFTTFSDFTLASIDLTMPLPVELLAFEAVLIEDKVNQLAVELDWRTLDEVGSDYFVVERSQDQVFFEDVGRVEAKGKSSGINVYQMMDQELEIGVERYYYRLRMVDRDGSFAHSEVRTVVIEGESAIDFFPNPASEYLDIRTNGLGIERILIYNSLGQMVLQKEGSGSFLRIQINDLVAGTYFAHLLIAGKTEIRKVMVW